MDPMNDSDLCGQARFLTYKLTFASITVFQHEICLIERTSRQNSNEDKQYFKPFNFAVEQMNLCIET